MPAFNKLVQTIVLNPGQGAASINLPVSTLVPLNNKLVIEFVSTSSEMPSGQKPDPVIVVVDKNGSAVVQHYPVAFFQLVYNGADIYKSATSMRMELARDLTLRVVMTRDATVGQARCFFGISGRIVRA
jgi:hypothetical protein